MACSTLRNFIVFSLLLLSLGSWAQTQSNKRSWKDVGCSTESLYVRSTPDAKKVFVPAKSDCKARARLLGFDISVCDKCKPQRSKDNKSTTRPNNPSKDVTPDKDVGDYSKDDNKDDDKDNDRDDSNQDDERDSDDKKNGNNGHGNDKDKNDSSNPGNSNNGDGSDDDGSPGKSEGKGTSK